MGLTTQARLVPFSVVGTDISGTADILAESMRHCFKPSTDFGIDSDAVPTAKKKFVYVGSGTGVIKGVYALLHDTGSSTSITIDVKKNGTTILSAPIAITDANTDDQVVPGVVTVSAFSVGDVFTAELAVSSSTGAKGPELFICLQENSAPV